MVGGLGGPLLLLIGRGRAPHSSAFPVERPLGPAAAPSWISCSLPSLPACRATVCVFFYCFSPNFMCESAECRQGLCVCCRVSIKQRACAHAACCRHFLPANGQSHGGKGPGFIGPEQCRSELGKKIQREKKSRGRREKTKPNRAPRLVG